MFAAVLALAVGGILLGLRASGHTTRDTAIGSLSVTISPSIHGQVDAFIPIADWGVRAHAFRAPLLIHVEPRSVERGAVISAAGGNGTVLAEAERDARHAARTALLRAYLWALAGALLLGVVAALAQFGGEPTCFPGDFGQNGSATEAHVIVPRFEQLKQPVIAVSGNHDSSLLMRRLAAGGVIVLTDKGRLNGAGRTDGKPVQNILGMRVAGYPDPLESRHGDPASPSRIFSFADAPDGKVLYAAAEQMLLTWFDSLPETPDVVMVHENGLAQSLARSLQQEGYRRRLMILTGHDHRQHIDLYGHIVVVDGGTVGAGGVFGASKSPVGFAHLNLSPRGRLTSADLVQAQPFTGAAQADRVVIATKDPCRAHQPLVCHNPGGP